MKPKNANQNGKATTELEQVAAKTINLPEINFRQATFKIIGVSPLIVNRFPEKAITMMAEKQEHKAKTAKTAKIPEECYQGSLYRFEDEKRTGFPAVGFKAAMVRAGKQLGLPMTDTRGKFHIIADEGDLIEIKGKPEMRRDMVRLATGVADIRYRGEYRSWSANITIAFNASVISEEQLAQLLNVAGFSCGIGEWRPEKSNSGSYGLFRVI